MTIFPRSILILIFSVFIVSVNHAQITAIYQSPEAEYRSGMDLFEKEKYGAAQDEFLEVINGIENPFSPLRINAEYFDALCALELYNKDASYKLESFARAHPTSSHMNQVHFQFGRLSYRNRKYRKALESFEKVDVKKLSTNEKGEFYFKQGYCHFKQKKFDDARQSFENVVGTDSKYNSPAAYFIAHMDYASGNYSSALQKFEELSNDPNFRSVAPYYVVQIRYMQGDYQEVINTAPPLIINATEKRAAELRKVLGESYYHLNNYTKALPYLEQYQRDTQTGIDRDDHYVLGFTYYKTGHFLQAVSHFQKATGQQDTLAQYAWYYLAACYMEQNQKKFAANAFMQSYKLPFDRDVREDALFNHAQLAFELSYDPYNEAVKSLRAYLKAYPDSKRNDEAYNFLFKISLATRNFKDAREALESIQVKGADYMGNLQKITYYRGIELFNQFEYEEASEMFKKAVDIDAEQSITAESKYWLAESFFRLENYWGAKKYYLEFLSAKGAKKLPVYNMANYNMGYVYFNRKEYNGGIYYFKEFIARKTVEQPIIIADANLRLGDSWFVSKGYDNAISYYDNVIQMKSIDVDYAMIQKAKSLGVLQRYPEKINTLNLVITKFPGSSYTSEVYYELGNTYLVDGNPEKALVNFKRVANDFPKSTYAIKARLKSGLIYYNNGLNDLAVKTFKGVVEDYPGSAESKEALASLRNLYVEMGKANDYISYTNGLSYANVSATEKDSIIYTSGENLYMDGDYSNATKAFEGYLKEFPEGSFSVNATFFLAECLVKEERYADALPYFEDVIEKPKSEFTESALLKAADLSYDLDLYKKSLEYFALLEETAEVKSNITEAWYGQMKCSFLLSDYEGTVVSANKLLKAEKISDEMKLETMMISARSYYLSDEILLAKSRFREITEFSQGEAGAEAQYSISKITYEMNDLEASEKEVFELINQYASFDYWVASGFILLADIYLKQDNIFQAKQTLQSIIDNHDGEELKKQATVKLNEILASEVPEPVEDDGDAETIDVDGEEVELEEMK